MNLFRRTFIAAATGALAIAAAPASAQEVFPNKTIKIIVPFTAGGIVDSIARSIGEKLATKTGQLVEVAVHGGGVGAGTLLLQMLQNVGGTDCVLPVVDEIIQNQLAGLGIVAVAPCHGKRTLPF